MIDYNDHGLLLRPNNQLRPDLFSLNKLKDNDYWSLLCSTKLVKNFSEKQRINDKNSTDFGKLYWKNTGTGVNPKAKKKREKLDEMLKSASIRNIGSLRLHIVLHAKPKMMKLIEFLGNDIVVYFDEDLFKKLCNNLTEVCPVVMGEINKKVS